MITNEDTLRGSRPNARLLTVNQVAELLQISRWSVYRLIRANRLRSVQIRRRL